MRWIYDRDGFDRAGPLTQTEFSSRPEDRLKALVAAQPDATLAELRDALQTSAGFATILRELQQLDLTVNKNRTRPALRRETLR